LTRKPGAPDHSVRGVVHDFWIQNKKNRDAARKPMRKRTSSQAHKGLDKPVDLWDKVI
jgi:hypothetical protein